jgi:hypothetical protein
MPDLDAYSRHDWLMGAVEKRLREELADLQVEINEEKSRIVDIGRGESFGFLGFDFRRIRSTGRVACQLHAEAQETNGTAAEAQGRVPPLPIAASGSGRAVDQPDAARLDKLLRGRALQRMLQLHQRLGRKEGPAPYAAGTQPQGLRLDAVE